MYIEQKVNKIIQELQNEKIEFTINDIASHFNILLAYNDDVSCFVYYKGYPIIYIKRSDSKNEWIDFTHEIAHYFLHETDQRRMSKLYTTKEESEAYKFSVLFRMPQSEIEQYSLYTQQALINHFNVDYMTAHERLRFLSVWYASKSG